MMSLALREERGIRHIFYTTFQLKARLREAPCLFFILPGQDGFRGRNNLLSFLTLDIL